MSGSDQNYYTSLTRSSDDEFSLGLGLPESGTYSNRHPDIFPSLLKAARPPAHNLDSDVSTRERERKVLSSLNNEPLPAFGSSTYSSSRTSVSTRSSSASVRSEHLESQRILPTLAPLRRRTKIVNNVVPFQPTQPPQVDLVPQELDLISEHHVTSDSNIIPSSVLFVNAVNSFQQIISILFFACFDVLSRCIHYLCPRYLSEPSVEDYYRDIIPSLEVDSQMGDVPSSDSSQVDSETDTEDERFSHIEDEQSVESLLLGDAPGVLIDMNTQGDTPVLLDDDSRCLTDRKYPNWSYYRSQSVRTWDWSSDGDVPIPYDDQNLPEEVEEERVVVVVEVKKVKKAKVKMEPFARYKVFQERRVYV